jgi:hypothetical protein
LETVPYFSICIYFDSWTFAWVDKIIEAFPDGYYITSISSGHADFIGSQALKIEDYPVEAVFARSNEVPPKENEYSQMYYAPIYLTMDTILSGLHIASRPDRLNLTLIHKGQETELTIRSEPFEADEYLSWFWLLKAVPATDYVIFPTIYAQALKPELKKLGSDDVRIIINTHWHHDLTGGNLFFGRVALVIVHHSVRKDLAMRKHISLFDEYFEPYPDYALPDLTFSTGMKIYLNGEEITIRHFPGGHTVGDAVVYFKMPM